MMGGPNYGVQLPRHLGLYSYSLNNPVVLRDRSGREEGSIGDVAISFIPVVGPLRDFSRDLDKGQWGWAALDASMAILDAATLGGGEALHAGIEGGRVLAKTAERGATIARTTEKVVKAEEKVVKVVEETSKAAQTAEEVRAGVSEAKAEAHTVAQDSKAVDEATHGHHSDPKFMGGEPKQPLTDLPKSQHEQLHKDLNEFLASKKDQFGNHMRPQRGNSGAVIRRNFTRQERLNALAEFYKANLAKYPEAAADFFKQHPTLR
jgi:hypothetical protein